MEWIKKHLPGGGDNKAPFIVGSDKWMGSTAEHKGEKASSGAYHPLPPENEENEEQPETSKPTAEILRSKSMAPPIQSSLAPSRSQSMSSVKKKDERNPYVAYPEMYSPESGPKVKTDTAKQSSLYPKIYEGKPEEELAAEGNETPDLSNLTVEEEEENDSPVEAREECLVTVPNAIVHLVDEEQSPHLATGHFSIVRITQKGNGLIVLVRVGENLHWPLMKDEPAVKLDPTHYFFSLPVPLIMDDFNGSGNLEGQLDNREPEMLSYGVTFKDARMYKEELQLLDNLLEQYSSFSSPTLVHGDKQREDMFEKDKQLAVENKGEQIIDSKDVPNVVSEKYGGLVLPPDVVTSDGRKVAITEHNQADFWTTMAPNVDDYSSSAARGIAIGSGQIIRGIFWVRDSTATKLESGTIYLKSKVNPSDKPHNISPRTLRNLRRVRNMSRASENVAKGILTGVVKTAGFFSGAIITSRAGQKVFKLMPGEVALVSLDAFGKLFDAVEKATRDMLQSTSLMTENVVSYKYGESAGQVTQETLATAGHVVATAWTVVKLRKALNPKDGVKPTKTAMVKGLAKNVLRGK